MKIVSSDLRLINDRKPANPNAEKPPKTCEVMDTALFDPLLADTYKDLPPLR
jgi:hypothetical protein